MQAIRHRTGQLDSIKALSLDELEAMRLETAEKLKVLEEQYWGQTENKEVGGRIAQKYKSMRTNDTSAIESEPSPDKIPEKQKKASRSRTPKGILKNSQS